MNEKLKFLLVNLQQGVVYFDDTPNCVNSIVAIGDRHKKLLILRPEYRDKEQEIIAIIRNYFPMLQYTCLYGDAFTIDTWDKKIARFKL